MALLDDRLRTRTGGNSSVRTVNDILSGLAPPRRVPPPPPKKPGGWRGLTSDLMEFAPIKYGLLKPLEVLDTPRRGIISGIREAVDAFDSDPLTDPSWDDWRVQTRDVSYGIGSAFPDPTGNAWLDRAIGFVGDVALDPLTYATGGAGAAVRRGAYAAGREGRTALARKVYQTVLERATDPAAKAAYRVEAGVAAREVARTGFTAARKVLTVEEAARLGIPKSGIYMFGKHISKGNPLRVPGSGAVGAMFDLASTRVRLVAGSTSIGKKITSATTPRLLRAERLKLARGEVSPEEVWDTLSRITALDTYRAAAGASAREGLDKLSVLVREIGLDGDKELGQQVRRLLEGGAIGDALVGPAARVRQFLDELWQAMDDDLKAIDPTATIGKVNRYFPHSMTDEAWDLVRGREDLRKTLSVDDMDPAAAFQPRKLVADKVWFGHTLTDADLTVERLNAIAREKGGLRFDFFETDPIRALDKYVRQWAGQRAKVAMWKTMMEDGLLDAKSMRLAVDEDAAKAALKELRDATKAHEAASVAAGAASNAAESAIRAQLGALNEVLAAARGARVAAAAAVNVGDARIAVDDARRALQAALAEAEQGSALAASLEGSAAAEWVETVNALQRDIVDNLKSTLDSMDAAAEAERAIRLATTNEELAAAETVVRDLERRVDSLAARRAELAQAETDVVLLNAWLGSNLDKAVAGDILTEFPPGVAGNVARAVNRAVNPSVPAEQGRRVAEFNLGQQLLADFDTPGTVVHDLLNGIGKKKWLEHVGHDTLNGRVDRVLTGEADALESIHVIAAYMAKVSAWFGGEQNIPEAMLGRYEALRRHGLVLREAHLYQKLVEVASTKNPEWFAKRIEYWSSLSEELGLAYAQLKSARESLALQERLAREANERWWRETRGMADTRDAYGLDDLEEQVRLLRRKVREIEGWEFTLLDGRVSSTGGAYANDISSMEWAAQQWLDDAPVRRGARGEMVVEPWDDVRRARAEGVYPAPNRAPAAVAADDHILYWAKLLGVYPPSSEAVAAASRPGIPKRSRVQMAADIYAWVDELAEKAASRGGREQRVYGADDLEEVVGQVERLREAELAATAARSVEGAKNARVRLGQNKGGGGARAASAELHGEGQRAAQTAAAVDLEEFMVVSEVVMRSDFLFRKLDSIGLTMGEGLDDDILAKVRAERVRFWSTRQRNLGEAQTAVRSAWGSPTEAGSWAQRIMDADPSEVPQLADEFFASLELPEGAAEAAASVAGGDRFAAGALQRRDELERRVRAAKAKQRFNPSAESEAELARALADRKAHATRIREWYRAKYPALAARSKQKAIDAALEASGGRRIRTAADMERAVGDILHSLEAETAHVARTRRAIAAALGDPDASFGDVIESGLRARLDTPTARIVALDVRIKALEKQIEDAMGVEAAIQAAPDALAAVEAADALRRRAARSKPRGGDKRLRRLTQLVEARAQVEANVVQARVRKDKSDLLGLMADVDGWKLTAEDWRALGLTDDELDPSPGRRALVQRLIEREMAETGHAPFVRDASFPEGYRMVALADHVPPGEPLFRRQEGAGAVATVRSGVDDPARSLEVPGRTVRGREPATYVPIKDSELDGEEARRLAQEHERLNKITSNVSERRRAAEARLKSWSELLRYIGVKPGAKITVENNQRLGDLVDEIRRGALQNPFPLDPTVARFLGDPNAGALDAVRGWNRARAEALDAVKFDEANFNIDPRTILDRPSPTVGTVFTREEWEALFVPPARRAKAGVDPAVAERAWRKWGTIYGSAVQRYGPQPTTSADLRRLVSLGVNTGHATGDLSVVAARRQGVDLAWRMSAGHAAMKRLDEIDEEIWEALGDRTARSTEAIRMRLDAEQRRYNQMHWTAGAEERWAEASRALMGSEAFERYATPEGVTDAWVQATKELQQARQQRREVATTVGARRAGRPRIEGMTDEAAEQIALAPTAAKGRERLGRKQGRLRGELRDARAERDKIRKRADRLQGAVGAGAGQRERQVVIARAARELTSLQEESIRGADIIAEDWVKAASVVAAAPTEIARAEGVLVNAVIHYDQLRAAHGVALHPEMSESIMRSRAQALERLVSPRAGQGLSEQWKEVAALGGVLAPGDPLVPILSSAMAAEADLLLAAKRVTAAQDQLISGGGVMRWVDDLKEGFTTLEQWGLPGVQASAATKEVFDNFSRMQVSAVAEELSRLLGWYTKRFKAYATATPGFHLRNALSNTFMVFAAGGDPKAMLTGAKLYEAWLTARKQGTLDLFNKSLGDGAEAFNAAVRVMDAAGGGQQNEALRAVLGGTRKIDNNWFLRWNRGVAERVEGSARFMLAYDSVLKGLDFNAASARVRRFLFDYAPEGRTSLDDAVSQVIPFWTWMSRNLPLQIVNRWQNPRSYAIFNSAMRNLGPRAGEDDPNYLQEQGAVRIADGFFFMPDLGVNQVGETLRKIQDPSRLLADVNPILRVPAELNAGKRFMDGRRFNEQPQEVVGGPAAPLVKAFLDAIGQTSTVSKPGTGMALGQEATNQKANHALMSLLPPLAQLERLFPATQPFEDRKTGARLRYLGLPVAQG